MAVAGLKRLRSETEEPPRLVEDHLLFPSVINTPALDDDGLHRCSMLCSVPVAAMAQFDQALCRALERRTLGRSGLHGVLYTIFHRLTPQFPMLPNVLLLLVVDYCWHPRYIDDCSGAAPVLLLFLEAEGLIARARLDEAPIVSPHLSAANLLDKCRCSEPSRWCRHCPADRLQLAPPYPDYQPPLTNAGGMISPAIIKKLSSEGKWAAVRCALSGRDRPRVVLGRDHPHPQPLHRSLLHALGRIGVETLDGGQAERSWTLACCAMMLVLGRERGEIDVTLGESSFPHPSSSSVHPFDHYRLWASVETHGGAPVR